MSLVVFPFKNEDLAVIADNLSVAAGHERVVEVWAVAASVGSSMDDVVGYADDIERAHGTPVKVFAQDRLGSFRSGKGDGMNTALKMSAEAGFDRTHFYDADITNFDQGWIDAAEKAADRGFGVVRHRFPRAATDAMITWMITRPGLAKIFAGTVLPRLGQPLGGEILLSGRVVENLAEDRFVRDRSDWGIDTVLTHATAVMGEGIFETNIEDGKRHALYGSLFEIEPMLVECLDAVQSLARRPGPPPATIFERDEPTAVPEDLKQTVGYDLAATRAAVADPPSEAERAVLLSLGVDPDDPGPIDAVRWGEILERLLAQFDLNDPAWRASVFRVWVERVITYTTSVVSRGYDDAMTYLAETIDRYEREGLG